MEDFDEDQARYYEQALSYGAGPNALVNVEDVSDEEEETDNDDDPVEETINEEESEPLDIFQELRSIDQRLDEGITTMFQEESQEQASIEVPHSEEDSRDENFGDLESWLKAAEDAAKAQLEQAKQRRLEAEEEERRASESFIQKMMETRSNAQARATVQPPKSAKKGIRSSVVTPLKPLRVQFSNAGVPMSTITKSRSSVRSNIGSLDANPASSVQSIMSTTTVSLNLGTRLLDIPIRPAASKNQAVLTGVICSKKARESLSTEKKNQLFRQLYSDKTLGSNRLRRFSIHQNDESLLETTCLVSQQLQKLSAHLTSYDMSAIFHCVHPIQDTELGIETDNRLKLDTNGSIVTTSLFTQAHLLNPDEVALSQIWLHYWAGVSAEDTSFQDDQWVSMKYIELNTDPDLFNKCLEHLKEFPVNAHGGPLLLALIQEQIQNSSEPAMKNLLSLVSSLKISKYPGEDVSKYVTQIRAVHSTLLSASEAGNLHFDQESFVQTVVERLQTTSVPEFNEPYKMMMAKAIDEMDQPTISATGRVIRSRAKRTKFPPLEAILTGAEAKYSRLIANSSWNVSKHSPAANTTTEVPAGFEDVVGKCWNCGSPEHNLPQCPHPRDEAKIKASWEKWKKIPKSTPNPEGGRGTGRGGRFSGRGRSGRGHGGRFNGTARGNGRGGGRGSQPPPTITATPATPTTPTTPQVPMKVNKYGVLVHDQQKIRELQLQEQIQQQTEKTFSKFAQVMVQQLKGPATADRTTATAPLPLETQENISHPLVSFAPTEPITTRGMDYLEAIRASILAASEATQHYTA